MQFSTHYIWQSAFSIKYKVKVNGVIGKWKKVLWNVSNMCHKTCILKSVSKKIDSQLTLSQKNTTYMSISCLDFMWHKYKSIQFVFFSGQTLIILHSLTHSAIIIELRILMSSFEFYQKFNILLTFSLDGNVHLDLSLSR